MPELEISRSKKLKPSKMSKLRGGLEIKHTVSPGFRISSFEKGKSFDSFPGECENARPRLQPHRSDRSTGVLSVQKFRPPRANCTFLLILFPSKYLFQKQNKNIFTCRLKSASIIIATGTLAYRPSASQGSYPTRHGWCMLGATSLNSLPRTPPCTMKCMKPVFVGCSS